MSKVRNFSFFNILSLSKVLLSVIVITQLNIDLVMTTM